MISFQKEHAHFTYRASGVVLHEGDVLLNRNASDEHYVLPGGRCEMMENSRQTLQREFREELGVEVSVGRLLWVVEYFFRIGEVEYHRLEFFYEVQLPESHPLFIKERVHQGIEKSVSILFEWHPVDLLAETPLYPTFLRQGLQSLPESTEHLLHDER